MDVAMVTSLSSNIVSSVGWYVDSGASRHMAYNKSLFNKFQEQEGGMCVELGDDATYIVKGLGSISFQMPLGDVHELNDVLFVLGLKKNILLIFVCRASILCCI
jgi:hypothetical protein